MKWLGKISFIAVFCILRGLVGDSSLWAQHRPRCSFDERFNKRLEALGITQESYEAQFRTLIDQHRRQSQPSRPGARGEPEKIYHIPIVFHLFYTEANNDPLPDNVSYLLHQEYFGNLPGRRQEDVWPNSLLETAVRDLNKGFSQTFGSTLPITDVFQSVAAGDTRIRFGLARVDPDGFPTNGIVRTKLPLPFEDISSKSLPLWDITKYLNIYVWPDVIYGGGAYGDFPSVELEGLTPGYTHPNNVNDFFAVPYKLNFLRVDNNKRGEAIGMGYGFRFKNHNETLIHEMGHVFGLYHPFGNRTCEGTDYCDDTPVSDGLYTDVGSNGLCTFGQVIERCGNRVMSENYMAYTSCQSMFTQDQKERMRTAAEYSNLRNLTLTAESILNPPTSPANDLGAYLFDSIETNSCTGATSVDLHIGNYGTNSISSYTIEIYLNNNLERTLSSSTPLASYERRKIDIDNLSLPTSGAYNLRAEITAVNGAAADEDADNQQLTTLLRYDHKVSDFTLVEDFEDNQLPDNWIFSEDIAPLTSITSSQGNKMLMIDLMRTPLSDFQKVYTFHLPTYDFTSFGANEYAEMSFRYSFQGYADSTLSELDVYSFFSKTSCGTPDTAQLLHSAAGIDMYTSFRLLPGEAPRYEEDWRTVRVPIGVSSSSSSKLRGIYFSLANGRNGRLYIDDIQFTKKTRSGAAKDFTLTHFTSPVISCRSNFIAGAEIVNLGTTPFPTWTVNNNLIEGESPSVKVEVSIHLSAYYSSMNLFGDVPSYGMRLSPVAYYFNQAAINEHHFFEYSASLTHSQDEDATNNALSHTFSTYFPDTVKAFPVTQEEFNTVSSTLPVYSWHSTTSVEEEENWQRMSNVARASFFNNSSTGKAYTLTSPLYVPSVYEGKAELSLSFYVSYAHQSASTQADRLQLVVFLGCVPVPYAILYDKSGSDLSVSAQASDRAWAPQTANDWRAETIDLTQYISKNESLMFMFVATNEGGNHIYLDDIQFHDTRSPTLASKANPAVALPSITAVSSFTLPSAAGEDQELSVSVSRGGWTAAADELWITGIDYSDQSKLVFDYQANEGSAERTATITITSTEDSSITHTITIRQAGTITITAVSSLTLPSVGGEDYEFSVSVSRGGWTAAADELWITGIDYSDQSKLVFDYQANAGTAERTATITITSTEDSSITHTITIRQAGTITITAVSSLSLPSAAGEDQEFSVVVSRGGWTAAADELWITGIDYSDQSKLVFDYQANPGTVERTATITITSTENSSVTHTITIRQAGTITITAVSSLTLSVAAGEDYEFSVAVSRGGWTAAADELWITGIDYSDQSKLVFDYQANAGTAERTATITITSTENSSVTHTITIRQAGTITITAVSSLTLSVAAGEDYEFSVAVSSGNWTASTPADWITGIDYSDQSKLVFDYQANAGTAERTATITITSTENSSVTHTITIRQAGTITITAVSSLTLSVAAGEDYEFSVSVSRGGWTAAADELWITGIDYSDQSKLVFDYQANAGTVERTATITITSTENSSVTHTITIRQAGTITITAVSSLTLSVAAGEDYEFSVSVSRGSWTAAADELWITGIDYSDQSKLVFDYQANAGTAERTATITITSTENSSVTHTITIRQAGTITITAVSSLTLPATAGEDYEFSVSVSRGGWTAAADELWITGIDYSDQSKLVFDYQANAGTAERTATITITSTENSSVTHTITIRQAGTITITAVSSLTLSVAAGEDQELSVAVSRGRWTASTPADWITGIDYSDQSKLVFDYQANAGTAERTATITITSTENSSVTHTITIRQAGTITITAVSSLTLPATAGEDYEFSVSVSRGGWTAAADELWITGIDYSDQSKLVFDYQANAGTAERTATITITSTENSSVTHTITIRQAGTITITAVSSLTLSVAAGEDQELSVAVSRGRWTASTPADWITGIDYSDQSKLVFDYQANAGTAERTATITITSTENSSVTHTITIRQAGTITITAVSSLTLPATAGEDYEFSVSVSRGGWTAATPADWITGIDYSDQSKLVFDYQANAGTAERTATITITSTEDPTITHTITIRQAGTITITAVSSLTLPATAGEDYEFSVSVSRGGWTAATPADWITGIDYSDQSKLVFDYQANAGTAERTATITITSTEDPTITHTITIRQAGTITITAVSSLSLSVAAGEDYELSVVVSRGRWIAAANKAWITGIDYSDQSKLVFDYQANAGTAERTATITITSTENSSVTHAITINQSAPEPEPDTDSEPDLVIYPNPLSIGSEINIKPDLDKPQDVEIFITQVSGRHIWHVTHKQLSAHDESINLRPLIPSKGVYILCVKTLDFTKCHHLIYR